MGKKIKVTIRNNFGEVKLESGRRKDKLAILVVNALDLISRLSPKKENLKEKRREYHG